VQVKLQFLCYNIILAQDNWHISTPNHEKLISFTCIESLTHVLNRLLLILHKSIFVSSLWVTHFSLKHLYRPDIPVSEHVLLNGLIDIFLSRCKLV